MEKVIERFLKYARMSTQSDEESTVTPSTARQLVFAKSLKEELEQMGLTEISLDEKGYLMATFPANTTKEIPTIGFISHMDTSPDLSGKDVKPRIVENYDGSPIVLCEKDQIIMDPKDFPEMLNHKGEDIVVTDGHTLLGADDKAGIAEILTAIEYLQERPEIKHGKVRIGFTPDEEIGRGADFFDVEKFGCEWAYTMDGGEIGELEYENFNAAGAKVTFNGRNVHPGYAKHKMINSMHLANQFMNMMPKGQVPELTEGYQGFYHLISMKGEVEQTVLGYIIRDFDQSDFEHRKLDFEQFASKINDEYGVGTVECVIHDQYYNMREKVEPMKHVIDLAYDAMKEVGVTPTVRPIRGGTDGARLSFMGLPCPNIFAGGLNFHGRYESLPVPNAQKAMETVAKIIELLAKK
ncbi:MAG: peptidase T [Bacteroidaceae bacterium]